MRSVTAVSRPKGSLGIRYKRRKCAVVSRCMLHQSIAQDIAIRECWQLQGNVVFLQPKTRIIKFVVLKPCGKTSYRFYIFLTASHGSFFFKMLIIF